MHKNKPQASPLVLVVLIALFSLALYFNALSAGFVYDDKEQIVQNHWIRDLRHIPEIFSESVWGFAAEVEDQGTANYYRPFMHLVYMACYYLFGLKPWGFHLVNVLFHAGVSALAFFIIMRLLGEDSRQKAEGGRQKNNASPFTLHVSRFTFHNSRFVAFVAALLFAAHPIHTEAVTWVASLPEVAFTFFFLLSFYFYMQFRPPLNTRKAGMANKGIVWYVLSLASFAVSVLFKEPALTLPVILFAYDVVLAGDFGNKSFKRLALRYVPYFVIAIIYLLLRLLALKSMVPTETFGGLSAWQSIISIFPLFREYLKDLIFPFDLKFWHAFEPLETLFNPEGLLSLFTAAAFAAALYLSWKRNRTVFFGLLIILVPLLPAFYIKGIGSKPYAERYLYLSSVGFVLIIASLFDWLRQKKYAYGAAAFALIALTGAYSVQTVIRNPVWKNDFSFYEDTIAKAPDAVPLRIAYGVALEQSGRLDEAIEQYQAAIRLGPGYWQAYANLGVAYGKKGLLGKAIEQFEATLRLKPSSSVTRSNLGLAYMRKGSIDRAIEELQAAARLNPGSYVTRFNLANAYEKKGLIKEALGEYRETLRLRPDDEEALYLLGRAHANAGQLDEAIEQFVRLINLTPENPSHHNTLGALYGQKGSLEKAIEQFEEAVRLAPDKQSYRENLERARKGR